MSKTKVIIIKGGLGNQMFEYAFGKALEAKTKNPVRFDVTSFYAANKSVLNRDYNLKIFDNSMQIASEEEIKNAKGKVSCLPKFLRNLFKIKEYSGLVVENGFCKYNECFFTNDKFDYYDVFCQNEKYFKDIEDIIRKEFTFPEIKEDYNKEYARMISESKNPVFIHVRRSDYAERDRLKLEYYKNAVKYIQEHVENPEFFVFGAECPDYIEKEFDIGCDFKFIGKENVLPENSYVDMQLMTMCKHGIVANSTYSWWGAWLINNKDKIITAPYPWTRKNISDIIPDSWVKVPVKFSK